MTDKISKKKPLLVLAPMAGITDLPFRLVCKEHGADIVYSEMISATGLFYEQDRKTKKSIELAKSVPAEQPLVIQLFGNNPEHFAYSSRLLSQLPALPTKKSTLPTVLSKAYRPAGIDINFGCPVKKVMKQNSGCALMRKPELAKDILKAILENTDLPVSIKIRAGIENIDALKFLESLADLDWKSVIVHGRTYCQGFSGAADVALIKKIKKCYPQKIVIANGGIFSPEIARQMLEETAVDGLAIGRGVMGNPWIFQQIKDFLATGTYAQADSQEIKKTMLRHAHYLNQFMPPKYWPEIRKHLGWYFKNIPGAKELRNKLSRLNNFEDISFLINQL